MIKIEIDNLCEDIKLVRLEGVLDNTTIAELEKVIDPVIRQLVEPHLIMDLTKLTYLNSTGIAKLLQYHIHIQRLQKGYFRIFGISDFIREILDICGALRLLEIYPTQEEARKGK